MNGRAALAFFILFAALPYAAQDLPNNIRGYKVYRPKIERTSVGVNSVPVSLQASKLVSISPLGLTFETAVNIAPLPQDARIDLLTFHDFTVNGVGVEIEDFATPFSVRKHEPISLPGPASIFLSTPHLAHAAWTEMRDSKPDWLVKGRVFVFGRFKKFGITFKRVVPVDVSFLIKNPVR